MNLTYYGFEPFEVAASKITVMDVGTPKLYRDLILGLRDGADTISLSNEDFESVLLSKSIQWYGDPMLTVDLNGLFQRNLQAQLEKLVDDAQVVKISDDIRALMTEVLSASYMMDVPLELPEIPELKKLIKFSGIQLSPEVGNDAYGIIEALIKVVIELGDHRMIVLTNVSHYLSVNQLQSLVRLMATVDLPLLLIEFSDSHRVEYFQGCEYHYIDRDFVLW